VGINKVLPATELGASSYPGTARDVFWIGFDPVVTKLLGALSKHDPTCATD
jgi:hypothetical protein